MNYEYEFSNNENNKQLSNLTLRVTFLFFLCEVLPDFLKPILVGKKSAFACVFLTVAPLTPLGQYMSIHHV